MKNSIDTEKIIVSKMIDIYCLKYHKNNGICKKCTDLKIYSFKKLDRCKYKENKPSCKNCNIHCYDSEHSIYIKKVMKYSGPRLLLKNPLLASKHLYKLLK